MYHFVLPQPSHSVHILVVVRANVDIENVEKLFVHGLSDSSPARQSFELEAEVAFTWSECTFVRPARNTTSQASANVGRF